MATKTEIEALVERLKAATHHALSEGVSIDICSDDGTEILTIGDMGNAAALLTDLAEERDGLREALEYIERRFNPPGPQTAVPNSGNGISPEEWVEWAKRRLAAQAQCLGMYDVADGHEDDQ